MKNQKNTHILPAFLAIAAALLACNQLIPTAIPQAPTIDSLPSSDLTAITTIEAKATQELNSFNLDFIGFDITAITVNEEPADFERAGQELTVIPDQPLTENESFTVQVEYSGAPEVMYSQALHF